jgi:predicted translin family RNA/ssDNA-binding protein
MHENSFNLLNESCRQREENLKKLKVKLTECEPKVNQVLPSSVERDSAETKRLQQTLNEVKSRLEQLEVNSLYICELYC